MMRVADPLSSMLFGRTRLAVLSLLLGRPDETFYLREICRWSRAGQGAVQRELRRLVSAGIIRRTVRGRQVFFEADPACPIFEELRGIVLKTAGLADVLREALQSLAEQIIVAFVYGSFAEGRPGRESDVDLCIVGAASFAEVVAALGPAQERLAREINPTVYGPKEFAAKLASGHHFVSALAGGGKLFLIGTEHEFAELAKERLARATPTDPSRNRRSARRR